MLQVEENKLKKGLTWLKQLLYETLFTSERLQIIATKMSNHISQMKRSGNKVASTCIKTLCYIQDSNQRKNSMHTQQKFLTDFLKNIKSEPDKILSIIEGVREKITRPSNMVLYMAANLKHFTESPSESLKLILPEKCSPSRNK